MKKKIFVSLIIFALVSFSLAGCGNEDASQEAVQTSGESFDKNQTDVESNTEVMPNGGASDESVKTGESAQEEVANVETTADDASKHSNEPYADCWYGIIQCDREGHYLLEDYCFSGSFHDASNPLILRTEFLDTLTEAQRNGKELIQLDKEGLVFGQITFFTVVDGMCYSDNELLCDKMISVYEEVGDDDLTIDLRDINSVATADTSSEEDDFSLSVGYLRMYDNKDWLDSGDKCCYYKPIQWTNLAMYSYLIPFEEAFPTVEVRPVDCWPDPSEYGLVSLLDGTQLYLSSIDVAEIDSIIAEPNAHSVWTKRMEELNAKYNISGLWCTFGKGCSFGCGTDNYDDIVKTQQLLDEIASTYGYTVQYRYGEK